MTKSLSELLTLRSEWEHIVLYQYKRKYDLPFYHGTLDNLKWFIEHGARNNRFRKNFNRATKIANIIVEESRENEKIDLSSLGGETL